MAIASPDANIVTSRRLDATRVLLRENGLDLIVAAPGSDLAYLIGHFSHASERPVFLIVSASGAEIVIAGFESRALPALKGLVTVTTYGETDDPYALAEQAITRLGGADRAAISDQAWSASLLGLQKALPDAGFVTASPYLRELRMVKDATELAALRTAGVKTDTGVERFLDGRFSGSTERELAGQLRVLLATEGLDGPGAIVASGPNGASPHHSASDRVVEPGDVIVIDCGGRWKGYFSDITRTVVVGEPAADVAEAYAVVKEAQAQAVAAVRPEQTCEGIDRAARDIIAAAGFGDAFIHRTGHGLGLDGHEEPYLVAGNELAVKPGMVFSVEPGVYFSGRFGVRIEDTVAVTEAGVDSFNHVTRELVTVQ